MREPCNLLGLDALAPLGAAWRCSLALCILISLFNGNFLTVGNFVAAAEFRGDPDRALHGRDLHHPDGQHRPVGRGRGRTDGGDCQPSRRQRHHQRIRSALRRAARNSGRRLDGPAQRLRPREAQDAVLHDDARRRLCRRRHRHRDPRRPDGAHFRPDLPLSVARPRSRHSDGRLDRAGRRSSSPDSFRSVPASAAGSMRSARTR